MPLAVPGDRLVSHARAFSTEQSPIEQDPREVHSRRAVAPWHAMAVAEVVAAQRSDPDRGLTTAEVDARLRHHGPNALPEHGARSVLRVLLRQFASPLIYLLMVAAGISVALGHRSDAVVILVVLVVNAVVGALQEGRAERSLRALRALSRHTARVVRDGRQFVVDAREVVPGDVLLVEAGDAIASDARVLEAVALRVTEAALTGESEPVDKHAEPVSRDATLADRTDMIFAGTLATAGRARALVVATGLATEIGRIATLTETTEASKTPLERRIAQFGRYLVVGALLVFALIIGVGLIRGMAFADILMVGISQLVGMIPEGLPVAMTVALAVGVQRMARRQAVVRQLSAVETLGATTVICTDKTGTLTRNEMMVAAIVLPDGSELTVTGSGYASDGGISKDGLGVTSEQLRELLDACVLCNDAQLDAPKPPLGDPTEIALLVLAQKGGVDPSARRAALPRCAEVPFDPSTKLMATEHHGQPTPLGPFVVVKGAPEVVVEMCTTMRENGAVITIDERVRRSLHAAADSMAGRALRVLAFAVMDNTHLGQLGQRDLAELRGCRFLGLVGQIDPPRAEVASAIARCRAAGVRPVMITGDHAVTGMTIAAALGIARDNTTALDGRELANLSDADLAQRVPTVSVFARVAPEQKLRIVGALQARGEVVAMTGDGVNDAPALVKADVGVAMGKTGTDVAKEASKIVITDDNFATIVSAVEEGRVVYRNIKKAILTLFSSSAAEVVVLVGAMMLGYPAPFAAVQILWNNLVTEGLITVNLVLEPAEGDEMQRAPIPRDEPLLTRALLTRMAVLVPTIAIATLGWFVARSAAGIPVAQVQTETFTLLAICEWFNVLNCRSETKSALDWSLLRNPWLLGGLVVANLMQVGAVFWGPLNHVLHTVPFDLDIVIELGLVGSTVLWVEELRKWRVRRALRSGVGFMPTGGAARRRAPRARRRS
ncbi:MAG: HAD-IC family P-type ATPase [Kofleriaceae bacterium]|nr:HAD-IC family P-type ATPase [Kofleriaceae bacterium]